MNRTKWLTIGVVTLLIVAIPFVFHLYYATPDDPRYVFLLSGAYTGVPCPEVVFVGSLFGNCMSCLYDLAPQYEWFSIAYFTFSLFAFVSLVWTCLANELKPCVQFVLLVLLTLVHVYLTFTPQSTMLATELGFASLIMLLNADGRYWIYIVAVLLFFFGTQMRFDGVFIAYMIGCPLFLRDFCLTSKTWWTKRMWLFGIVAAAVVTLVSNKLAYSGEEWDSFKKYNSARGYIADIPSAGELTSTIADEKDRLAYDLFCRYRIFDQNILTQDKLDSYKKTLIGGRNNIVCKNIRQYLLTYYDMGGMILILVLIVTVGNGVRKRRWLTVSELGLSLMLFVAANLYMMTTSQPKERVIFFSFITLWYVVFMCAHQVIKRFEGLVIVVALYFGCIYINKDYNIAKSARCERTIVKETEQMLEACPFEKVMLPVPTELTPEVFHTSESPIAKKGVIQGWMHFYPKANLSYKPFTAYINGLPLLVKKDAMEQVDIIQRLLQLHYGIDSETKVMKESKHYNLVKLYNCGQNENCNNDSTLQ